MKTKFPNLKLLARNIRDILGDKKCYLLFAYNGTGKTRLSCEFKNLSKAVNASKEKEPDTLYYNAFTEDLFTWDNHYKGNLSVLEISKISRFFDGVKELEMETKIRKFMDRYVDFHFKINYDEWHVMFYHNNDTVNSVIPNEYIKISRGEERIFVWCFFLAIVQLVIDNDPAYYWVKYIYIDDPISSLDENNIVTVACQLSEIIKNNDVKFIISTHHTLFFNVLYNELKKESVATRFLSRNNQTGQYTAKDTEDTPFFHHVALIVELKKAADTGKIYTYHFNILRNILEKTATFHGFDKFSACIKEDPNDLEGTIHLRMSNLLSHGGYSLYEPIEMVEDNKKIFKEILYGFLEIHNFNDELFKLE